jgi:antitoxin MazE
METGTLRTTSGPSRRGGAVRLPRDILERAGLKPGDPVDVTVERGRVVVTAVEDGDRLVDWGPDRGSEVIDDAYSRGEITFDEVTGEFVSRPRVG